MIEDFIKQGLEEYRVMMEKKNLFQIVATRADAWSKKIFL